MRWIWWHHSPTSAVGVSSVSERVLTGVLDEDMVIWFDEDAFAEVESIASNNFRGFCQVMEGGCLAQRICFLCRICEYSDRTGLSDVSGPGNKSLRKVIK